MTSALVLATLSVTLSGQPYMTQQWKLEPKMCGVTFRAEIPKDGQWVPASGHVVCAATIARRLRAAAKQGRP